MKYISTRGHAANEQFCDILLGGLAPDGGLYLPEVYPQVSATELAAWRHLSYAELAFAVLSKYCTDILPEELAPLVSSTYSPQAFAHVRAGQWIEDITPLTKLGVEKGAPLSLLSLSNGPTLAFKDMAMQLLGQLFEYVLKRRGQRLNILGATSGDTGSAAEYAMRGKKGINVFMLSPKGKMSAFQTAQMFSLMDDNIFNIAIEGVFDDCQDIVKAVSNDHAFKAAHSIGTVNSINWARVIAQVVYYFKGYFAATKSNDEKVSFTVPSGNFGNVCAGHIARQMGLPIHKLVVATNENNVLDEFFKTGVYRVRTSENTHHTSSPSMDISKASNFERFIFDLMGRDAVKTAALFKQVEQEGFFDISATPEFVSIEEKYGFVSGRSTHKQRLQAIREVFKDYKQIIDPHTADGVYVAFQYLEKGMPMVVLETAQAAKFEQTIHEALNLPTPRPDAYVDIEKRPQRFESMTANVDLVKAYINKNVNP
ncbi:threonine synthase [Hydromonas duriensis]|uniref:Threonine synthase n=1 Tax=Hydromonas duriensis TaxID=1527608 RepID=A0A4R6YB59_9BURK|nr:threonine synthase [Hydromonas duriensis]TDR32851.1 L-threonine synthase [Hydromonas duriensis]